MECLALIVEPANKATALFSPTLLYLVNNFIHRSGFSSLELLGETFIKTPVSLMFPYHSPLVEIFNEKIHQMLSNGLIYHIEESFTNPKGLIQKLEEIGPQVLTMEHLVIGFLICLCPLMLSVLVFVGELSVFKVRACFNK